MSEVLFGDDREAFSRYRSVAISTVAILHDEVPSFASLMKKYARYGSALNGTPLRRRLIGVRKVRHGRGSTLTAADAVSVPLVLALKACKLVALQWGAVRGQRHTQ
jgi:hypothetical protein